MSHPITALVIMGVAGCGKTCVSEALCQLSGATAIEGDTFHPAANIEKMSAGIPLNDDDRAGWLDSLCDELRRVDATGKRPVLTCSALKHSYREVLRSALRVPLAMQQNAPEVAAERVSHRPGHFMPATLIESQFATLESPKGEPLTLALNASIHSVDELASQAHVWWQAHGLKQAV